MINLGRRGLTQVCLGGRAPPSNGARRLQFGSPRDALDMLRGLVIEPGHMALLRRLLAEERGVARGFDGADADILRLVAQRLFTGQLTATAVRPRAPDHQIGAPAPAEITPGKAPEEKPRASPIVPPEYIILARRESNQTTNDERKLDGEIGKLSFAGFSPARPPSVIAGEYPSVAEVEQLRLEKAGFDLSAAIGARRYAGYDKTRAPSAVADVFPKTAEMEGKRTSVLASRFGQRVDALRFERHDANRPRSSISQEYTDIAALETKGSKWAVEQLGEAVSRLEHEPTRLPRAASSLAQEYTSVARAESNLVGGAVLDTRRRMDELVWVKKELEDSPPSAVAEEAPKVAAAQAATVRSALDALVADIGALARAGEPEIEEAVSRVAGEVRSIAADNGQRAERAVSSFVTDLRKLAFSGFDLRAARSA